MSALRKQMDGDLVVRAMAVRTREAYLGAVAGTRTAANAAAPR